MSSLDKDREVPGNTDPLCLCVGRRSRLGNLFKIRCMLLSKKALYFGIAFSFFFFFFKKCFNFAKINNVDVLRLIV